MQFIDFVLDERLHFPLRHLLVNSKDKMGKRLVTIGWDNDKASRDWIYFFKFDLGFEEILIIEAYEPNARAAQRFYGENGFIKVYNGTIQEAVDDPGLWQEPYDTCLWSHGPEHVPIEDHKVMLPKLFARLRRMFIAWCPWGNWYGLGEQGRNKYQTHQIVDPTHDTFNDLNLGLIVRACIAQKDSPDGLLYMYKDMEDEG